MPLWINLVIVFIIFLLLFSIQLIVKEKHPFKKMLTSMIKGICTLIAVNIAGLFTGVMLPVSLLSLCVAAVVGIPGVTAMLLFNIFL